MTSSQRIVLTSRPQGGPTPENFRLEQVALAAPGAGELLLQVRYLSLDPYMRGRMSDAKSYAPPVPIFGVMSGETLSEVIASEDARFNKGDLVLAHTGWCSHAVMSADAVRRADSHGAPVSTTLGVLGMPGFTAYSGMTIIGRAKPDETVVVAAASGPVGSLVGQLAQMAGARAVGIAGGEPKCRYVKEELGFDAVVDHRATDFNEQLRAACPDGIDVYFENVGGPIWDAVFPLLNQYARVPVCGLIAEYNHPNTASTDRLPATMSAILRRSLSIRGFINYEFVDTHFASFLREIGPKVAGGDIRYREDIIEGLSNAPEAFIGMLAGKNFGKLLIKVSE